MFLSFRVAFALIIITRVTKSEITNKKTINRIILLIVLKVCHHLKEIKYQK